MLRQSQLQFITTWIWELLGAAAGILPVFLRRLCLLCGSFPVNTPGRKWAPILKSNNVQWVTDNRTCAALPWLFLVPRNSSSPNPKSIQLLRERLRTYKDSFARHGRGVCLNYLCICGEIQIYAKTIVCLYATPPRTLRVALCPWRQFLNCTRCHRHCILPSVHCWLSWIGRRRRRISGEWSV